MKARVKWVEERTFVGESGSGHNVVLGTKGRALSSDKVKRAIDLSIEKYCSASAMLAKTATITHDFEVIDTTAK
ncbi:hypothetical protein EN943_01845 [Mesorhizobium sp. M7A.F.Ca.US.006.01.1.1]|uniref:hypothetical protein n=1 Tax=Mesorhizobium sp. M7A.F.Ca.US.006.01.1.1 TaxID=2496707 RepID=UPI000FCC15AC|nr:hypothetical protein [Mesorhizobium sp. M7A.F.Ca.US.006.01.1.1]RUZ81008.1 hypothetical protein EN943_01845 [Mesorhizobium sp. M7A.F.Ca.US.006.01.1.1]